MTSKEAFEKIREILEQYYHQFVKDNIKLETIEGYPINKIEKDLEVLEALKKHFYEEYQLPTGQHSLLFRINGTPEYKKIKEWLKEK